MEVFNVNIIAVILLIFIMFISKRNMILYRRQTKFFLFSCFVVCFLLIIEMIEVYLQQINSPNYLALRKINNVLGFSMSPLPFLFLVYFNFTIEENKPKFNIIYYLPIMINAVCSILSIWVPIIFEFKGLDYHRSKLFFLPMVTCIYYILILIFIIKNRDKTYAISEFIIILEVILIGVISFVLQILIKNLYLIWSSTTIGLVIYYILFREMQLKYDVMTGMKNRNNFEKDIIELQKENNVAIIVFDLNDLKTLNDIEGHFTGDIVITEVTSIIQSFFNSIGECYRIGGDEFVVLSTKLHLVDVEKKLSEVDKEISIRNAKNTYIIDVSYGYAFYHKLLNENIMDTFKLADKRMYEMKTKIKNDRK